MKVLVCSSKESMIHTRGNTNPEFVFFPPKNIEKIESLFDEVIWNETGRMFTEEELIEKITNVDWSKVAGEIEGIRFDFSV